MKKLSCTSVFNVLNHIIGVFDLLILASCSFIAVSGDHSQEPAVSETPASTTVDEPSNYIVTPSSNLNSVVIVASAVDVQKMLDDSMLNQKHISSSGESSFTSAVKSQPTRIFNSLKIHSVLQHR